MENNNEEKLENKKEVKIKLRTVIIIGIIVALVVVGIVVFANISQNNDKNINNKGGATYIQNNSTNTNSNGSSSYTPNNSTNTNNNGNSSYIPSNPLIDPSMDIDYKPIIYLYPEETTELIVKLGKSENITCSYPKYNNGWNVIANTDGTLIDKNTGRKLYSLYWEGIHSEPSNFEDGFVVKGADTIQFLEEKLAILGLNQIEAEEFIVYWLPKLQENEYNYIRFATMDEINKNMPLEFSVKPDTIIRILMQYKALDSYIEVNEQKLENPKRTGFVAVEWGGTEIK